MRDKTSHGIVGHLIIGISCSVLFIGQTYLFFYRTFGGVLAPFSQSPQVQAYIQDALVDVWQRMLIWPVMFFVILIASAIRIKRLNSGKHSSSHFDQKNRCRKPCPPDQQESGN